MDEKVKAAIFRAVASEPLARTLGMELLELDDGHSRVRMMYDPDTMANIYRRAHGGALFALLDEAFETVSQTDGTVCVALNVNITYIKSPGERCLLFAEAERISETRKTAAYTITVTDESGDLVAASQAVVYRTGKPIPFL